MVCRRSSVAATATATADLHSAKQSQQGAAFCASIQEVPATRRCFWDSRSYKAITIKGQGFFFFFRSIFYKSRFHVRKRLNLKVASHTRNVLCVMQRLPKSVQHLSYHKTGIFLHAWKCVEHISPSFDAETFHSHCQTITFTFHLCVCSCRACSCAFMSVVPSGGPPVTHFF